ncbi:PadR family transcriptional regulator [Sphingomonas sp. BT-65]|uniref:PadR family transcriptional regulator n=1 Tax=Sphingomonas sp. BT-65 TaxID=2989821 RepID=UPI002235896F|nr:PadR family transcriptional regulator [Sphingomonas sp. BT-65]MCW4462248.1 PadR family transcriptional regulator [Sphingomonas sp. BT-65]
MRILLEQLLAHAPRLQHGYELMKQTGLSSGTLYPLLMRMADQGLVEAEWQAPLQPGRPARHAYRLTTGGAQFARDALRDDGGAPRGVPFPA